MSSSRSVLAGAFVIGSYYLAEYVKVSHPRKQGRAPTAARATSPPAPAPVVTSHELAGARGD